MDVHHSKKNKRMPCRLIDLNLISALIDSGIIYSDFCQEELFRGGEIFTSYIALSLFCSLIEVGGAGAEPP